MLGQKTSKQKHCVNQELPTIPDKLYFTIGEVSKLCYLKPHVLRYWEQEFPQLKPSKRQGNRRYYQRKDVLIIREIMSLLKEQGFTIEGARAKLNNVKESEPKSNKLIIRETINSLEKVLLDLELH